MIRFTPFRLPATLLALSTLCLCQAAAADNRNNARMERFHQQRIGYCHSVYGNADCVPPAAAPRANCISNPHHASCPREIARAPLYTPEQWEQIQKQAKRLQAEMPVRCTAIANSGKRCWRAYFGEPNNRALAALYPKVELYAQDKSGETQGWVLEYGRGKLLWANFWQNGQPRANINFHDAPRGQANMVVYDGKQRPPATVAQEQALRHIGIVGMNLQESMHPDDFKELISAARQARQMQQ